MKMMPIYAATAAVLLSTTAMAQQAAPGTTVPQATPAAPGSTMGSSAATTITTTAFVNRQAADQHMASDLIGMAVRGPADETLGDINDLLIDRSGNVAAVVIGVGGFLGIGEKDVAVPFQSVEMTRNADGKERLVLRKTKDELKSAPTFTEADKAPATTGSVGSRPAAPPPATMPPATSR